MIKNLEPIAVLIRKQASVLQPLNDDPRRYFDTFGQILNGQ